MTIATCFSCSSSDSNREPSAPQTDASASWATRASGEAGGERRLFPLLRFGDSPALCALCSTRDSNPEPSGSEPDASTCWARRASDERRLGHFVPAPCPHLDRGFTAALPFTCGHPRSRTGTLSIFSRALFHLSLKAMLAVGRHPVAAVS